MPSSCENEFGEVEFLEVIGGRPPFQFSINGGQSYFPDRLFSDLAAAEYALVVQDKDDCIVQKMVRLDAIPVLAITLPSTTTLVANESFRLTPTLNLPDSLIADIKWSACHWTRLYRLPPSDLADKLQHDVSSNHTRYQWLRYFSQYSYRSAGKFQMCIYQLYFRLIGME